MVRPRSFCSVGAQNRLFSLSRLIDDREMRAGRATSRCGAADSHGMDSIASNSGRCVGPAKLVWAGGSAARDGPGPEWVSAVRVGSATAAGCAAAVRAGSSPAAGCAAAAGWVRDRARCVGRRKRLAAAPPGGDRFVVRPRSFCSVGAQNRLFSLSRLIDDREMRAGRATSRCGAADSHGMDSIASNSGRCVGPAKLVWAGGPCGARLSARRGRHLRYGTEYPARRRVCASKN